jgi:hypothetical protein
MIIFSSQDKIGRIEQGNMGWLNSQFLASYQRNLQAIRERTAWKTQGSGAQFMGVYQHQSSSHRPYQVDISGLTFANQGDIVYSISVDNGSGIFTKNPQDDKELEGHIIHKHDTEFCS